MKIAKAGTIVLLAVVGLIGVSNAAPPTLEPIDVRVVESTEPLTVSVGQRLPVSFMQNLTEENDGTTNQVFMSHPLHRPG